MRAYVFPATKLTYRARSSRVVKLTQRYERPARSAPGAADDLLRRPARPGERAARVATGEIERIRAGRYRSTAIVRLPAAWNGRFRYASCFRYTGGSGMGDPRASCPRKFRFR